MQKNVLEVFLNFLEVSLFQFLFHCQFAAKRVRIMNSLNPCFRGVFFSSFFSPLFAFCLFSSFFSSPLFAAKLVRIMNSLNPCEILRVSYALKIQSTLRPGGKEQGQLFQRYIFNQKKFPMHFSVLSNLVILRYNLQEHTIPPLLPLQNKLVRLQKGREKLTQ